MSPLCPLKSSWQNLPASMQVTVSKPRWGWSGKPAGNLTRKRSSIRKGSKLRMYLLPMMRMTCAPTPSACQLGLNTCAIQVAHKTNIKAPCINPIQPIMCELEESFNASTLNSLSPRSDSCPPSFLPLHSSTHLFFPSSNDDTYYPLTTREKLYWRYTELKASLEEWRSRQNDLLKKLAEEEASFELLKSARSNHLATAFSLKLQLQHLQDKLESFKANQITPKQTLLTIDNHTAISQDHNNMVQEQIRKFRKENKLIEKEIHDHPGQLQGQSQLQNLDKILAKQISTERQLIREIEQINMKIEEGNEAQGIVKRMWMMIKQWWD